MTGDHRAGTVKSEWGCITQWAGGRFPDARPCRTGVHCLGAPPRRARAADGSFRRMADTVQGSGDRQILDELEALQRAIRATREKRTQAEAAFGAQLAAFTPSASAQAPVSVSGPVAGRPSASQLPPRVRPPELITLVAADMSTLFADEPMPERPQPATPDVTHGRTTVPPWLGILVVLAIATAVGVGWRLVSARAPAAPPAGAATPIAAPRPAPAPPAPAPVDPHPLRIDVTTTRRRLDAGGGRWTDSDRAGAARRANGCRSGQTRPIVLRAGDAGAVMSADGSCRSGSARPRRAGRHPELCRTRAMKGWLIAPGTP